MNLSERGTPPLMERVRRAVRARHYSKRTEQAYAYWVRRYIFFHGVRHPALMGAGDISA
ncbi:MAG: phage integrase N-terminal SAM-like domain-containing protein [bacterium]